MNHQPNKLTYEIQRMSSRAQEGRSASVQRHRAFSQRVESNTTEVEESMMWQQEGPCCTASTSEEKEARNSTVLE